MADYPAGSFKNQRQQVGSLPDTPGGLEYIKGRLEGSLTDASSSILTVLLERRGLSLDSVVPDSSLRRGPKLSNKDLSDEDMIRMGKRGELSLFASILQHFEGETTDAVLCKTLIKNCLWTVPPHAVPASMDAKEFIMSAIHFLSLRFEGLSPFIEPVSELGDLEKRQYNKFGDWRLDQIIDQVSALEEVFLRDASSYVWMPRGYFVPKVADSHDLLLQKGTAPSSLLRKRKPAPRKTQAATKKKQAVESAVPSSATSATLAETSTSAVLTESATPKANEGQTQNDDTPETFLSRGDNKKS